nr:MAG TPA: hypothetical protein [Caudoviricetes sp.]
MDRYRNTIDNYQINISIRYYHRLVNRFRKYHSF